MTWDSASIGGCWSRSHAPVLAWLGFYQAKTPGLDFADNITVLESEPRGWLGREGGVR